MHSTESVRSASQLRRLLDSDCSTAKLFVNDVQKTVQPCLFAAARKRFSFLKIYQFGGHNKQSPPGEVEAKKPRPTKNCKLYTITVNCKL